MAVLVQEQPVLRILYHPVQALVQILACHGTAWENDPFMRLDQVQLEALASIDSQSKENEAKRKSRKKSQPV